MVNILLFRLLQTLNCQTLNNLCLCLRCSILSCRGNWLSFLPFWNKNRMTTCPVWFPAKMRPGTRVITNSGQLQNNCLLFVWQNQDNFVRSVIILRYKGLTEKKKLLKNEIFSIEKWMPPVKRARKTEQKNIEVSLITIAGIPLEIWPSKFFGKMLNQRFSKTSERHISRRISASQYYLYF